MNGKNKVILAYSGGLDTSVILKWLMGKGYDVIAYVADVGQGEDLAEVKKKAIATGASKVYVEDLKTELVTDYIFPAIKANAIYEGRYLLGTSLARPLIAKRQVEIAHLEKTKYVAHGSTGKGNDQVRFELGYFALDPSIVVISPWKDKEFLAAFQGRSDLIAYAAAHGIEVKASTAKPYSEDANLLHISHESGILEDPALPPSEDVFSWTTSPQAAPDAETVLTVHFKDGIPVKVVDETNGVTKTAPYELFSYLNEVGAANGIGRVDMVENRFVGIKSRGVYETPGHDHPPRGAHGHRGHRHGPRGHAAPRHAQPEVRRARLQRVLVLPGDGLPHGRHQQEPGGHRRERPARPLQGQRHDHRRGSRTARSTTGSCRAWTSRAGSTSRIPRGFININAIRLKAHNAIMSKRGKKVTDFMRNGK